MTPRPLLRAPFAGRGARKLVDDFQNVQPKQAIVLLRDSRLGSGGGRAAGDVGRALGRP